MAIIPLGPLTMPSMCKLPIISPGLPGGRLSGVPLPAASLASNGENGSRREIFSFTGTIAGSAPAFGISLGTSLGASAFASAAASGIRSRGNHLAVRGPGLHRRAFRSRRCRHGLYRRIPSGFERAMRFGRCGWGVRRNRCRYRLHCRHQRSIGQRRCWRSRLRGCWRGWRWRGVRFGAGAGAAAGFGAGVWPSRPRTLFRTDGDC